MAREVRTVCEGVYFGEGPRWRDGRLWFSDFFRHAVMSASEAGDLRVEFELDDRPSGLGWLPDGSLLLVSMTRRQVLRRFPDGTMTIHADLGHIADFHCNDMVVSETGVAFVGNFGFDLDAAIERRGIAAVLDDHPTARLARITPDGTTEVAADDLHFPNGAMISPDGRTLIVGESLGARLTAFDIDADGFLYGRRVWAPAPGRVPDGACLDEAGAVWFANAIAPECVRMAQGGEVLEVIDTGQPCFACMLGGEDGRTLFMLTAPDSAAETRARVPEGRLIAACVDAPHAGRP